MIKVITVLPFLFLLACGSTPKKETYVSLAENNNGNNIAKKETRVSSVENNNGNSNIAGIHNTAVAKARKTVISDKTLYLLIMAEIAGQRGQYASALAHYLQVIKQDKDARIMQRAAKISLYLKDHKTTDEIVALWLAQDNKNLIARKIATLSAFRTMDKVAVIEHLSTILQASHADFEMTLGNITKALDLKEQDKVSFIFAVLAHLTQLYPQQSVIYYVHAVLLAQVNQPNAAIVAINKALNIKPKWYKARILQAQLITNKGNLKTAKKLLDLLLAENPNNIHVKKILTQILIKMGQLDKAVVIYQNILSEKPQDNESQFALALVFWQQQKYDLALAGLKKLLNKPNWTERAGFYSGKIEYTKENYQQSLFWFDKVKQGLYAYDASIAAVSTLLKQKNFTEADRRLIQIMATYPSPKRQLNGMLLAAEIWEQQHNYQQAFKVLTGALVRFPDNRNALYARSLIAGKLNKLGVLETDLKIIILKNPADSSALNALGYALANKTQRYSEAQVYLQKAITLQPEETAIIDSMGWLQFRQGNLDKALKLIRKAYQKLPENEVIAHLIEILWVKGDKDEAKAIFANAFKKSSVNQYFLELLERFPQLNNQ